MDLLFFRKHIALLMTEKRWCDEHNSSSNFSHGKTNSGSVAIGYVRSKSFVLANKLLIKIVVFY